MKRGKKNFFDGTKNDDADNVENGAETLHLQKNDRADDVEDGAETLHLQKNIADLVENGAETLHLQNNDDADDVGNRTPLNSKTTKTACTPKNRTPKESWSTTSHRTPLSSSSTVTIGEQNSYKSVKQSTISSSSKSKRQVKRIRELNRKYYDEVSDGSVSEKDGPDYEPSDDDVSEESEKGSRENQQ